MSFSIKKSHKFLAPPAPVQAKRKKRDILGSAGASSATASSNPVESSSSIRNRRGAVPTSKPDGTQGLCIRESVRAQEDFY